MKFDLEEGNFCDVLLGKIRKEDDDNKKNNSTSPSTPNSINSDLEPIPKLSSCRQ
jgi:hypothetical protein